MQLFLCFPQEIVHADYLEMTNNRLTVHRISHLPGKKKKSFFPLLSCKEKAVLDAINWLDFLFIFLYFLYRMYKLLCIICKFHCEC